MRQLACVTATLIACAVYTAAQAQGPMKAQSAAGSQPETPAARFPVAGAGRPGSVPEGYVVTPFGYFDSSCVVRLAKGERMLASGRIQHANGLVDATARTCSKPAFTRDGYQMTRQARGNASGQNYAAPATSPEITGWVENAAVVEDLPNSFGALIARWNVPAQPARNDGQVIYLFPGLEDINNPSTSILQPVLAWYQGQWTITSWNCCISGVVAASNSVNVSPGDEIFGSVTNNCPGQAICATWNVLSLDMSTGQGTILENTPSEGQLFNWGFGGVLETYSVIACKDLPRDRRISFEEIQLFDQNLDPVRHVQWTTAANSSETPACDFGVKADPHRVTLLY